MTWCAKNFKVYVEPLPTDPLERFEFAIKKESEAALGSYLEDNCLIAEGLCFGFQTLTGHTLEQVTIENIAEVKPKNKNNGFINFKVIGNENGKAVKIGVAVIQYSHHIALGAGLRRLIDYQTFDLTRGCLVRSKSEDKKIKRNTMYYKLLDQLTSELGGEFVELIEEQIRPLIDIHSVYQKRETYNLSKEQIFDFIFQKKLAFENLLLREILSAPSGQIPDDAVEDDMTIYGAFLSPSTTDDTFDSDDLTDLFN